MSGPIPLKSLPEVQAHIGETIDRLRQLGSTETLLIALSISEYLKDAERWQHVMHNKLGLDELSEMPPAQLQKHVDAQLRAKK